MASALFFIYFCRHESALNDRINTTNSTKTKFSFYFYEKSFCLIIWTHTVSNRAQYTIRADRTNARAWAEAARLTDELIARKKNAISLPS